MDRFVVSGRTLGRGLAVALGIGVAAGTDAVASSSAAEAATGATLAAPARDLVAVDDSLFGRSGKLRARLLGATNGKLRLEYLARLFGKESIGSEPGIYQIDDPAANRRMSLIRMLPFSEKRGARIGRYHLGFWPAERGPARADSYRNPDGFIEVTEENQNTYVSEHFRLRDFLTKDQRNVWPKYLVLREELIDKLELVIAELERTGHPVAHMTVMSGFRTPQYNGPGGDGRSSVSRHMFGDAADVFVDNDGDGNMDDLNGDGRVNHVDAQVIHDAAERVERRFPDLVGGVGVYKATSAHGPFAHVDVRGRRARWGLL
jgi:uncharacterized protein YcbK (DUF882 family)